MVDVIGSGGGGPQPADGSRDILLVGLDSRTDAKGNPLPNKLLKQLRAGHENGELNTDTLILLHIPNDGSKAVALSLPRDSYVDIPGYGQHKINSAYARGKTVKSRELEQSSTTDKKRIDVLANQEGAKTLISTVEQLTGRTIDNYASINLFGFYEITKAIGGVDVCLKNAVTEVKSGADFKAGKQTISGAKALAFVRQRHGLPRGDLDRVVRQQVFMAGLARNTISAGTLTSPTKLGELQQAIERSVVLNRGWNVLDFAKQMSGLTGGQIQFRTIPVQNIDIRTPDGSAVQVDAAEVQRFVAGLSGSANAAKPGGQSGPDPANAKITVDVLNGAGVDGLAASVSEELASKGFTAGTTANADPRDATVVRHAPGEQASAQRVADYLAGNATLEPDPAHVEGTVTVIIGADYPANRSIAGGGSQPQSASQPPGTPEDDLSGKENEPITAADVPCVN